MSKKQRMKCWIETRSEGIHTHIKVMSGGQPVIVSQTLYTKDFDINREQHIHEFKETATEYADISKDAQIEWVKPTLVS